MADKISIIQEALRKNGSEFSYDEIQDILQTLRNVRLKVIVTNVPKEVYHYDIAKEAFENIFVTLDGSCTFVYLPSFNRVQVYVDRPEAALCARLLAQGWVLPDSVLTAIPDQCSTDHTGIRCFIDRVDEINEDDEEVSDDVDNQNFCQCAVTELEGTDDLLLLHQIHNGRQLIPLQETSDSVLNAKSSDIGCSTSQKPNSSELENTSEASGDDTTSSTCVACFKCNKPKLDGKSEAARRKMKLLAPPKLQRQFILSPPASPPVGWEPKPESEPVVNYELLEALASLAPGETFELHPGDEQNAHPSIVITPCESSPAKTGRLPIVQTRCPERTK